MWKGLARRSERSWESCNTKGVARRLFYLVVEAIILYAAPIWHEAANFDSASKFSGKYKEG